jgi:hypothetical protein
MPAFTFEIVRQGERVEVAKVVTLADDRAIWCHVEAMALRIKNGDGAFIRVKNHKGETVVRTGVAIAIASIATCQHTMCPLKKRLEGRALGDGNIEIELPAHFVPCEGRDPCTCSVERISQKLEWP